MANRLQGFALDLQRLQRNRRDIKSDLERAKGLLLLTRMQLGALLMDRQRGRNIAPLMIPFAQQRIRGYEIEVQRLSAILAANQVHLDRAIGNICQEILRIHPN